MDQIVSCLPCRNLIRKIIFVVLPLLLPLGLVLLGNRHCFPFVLRVLTFDSKMEPSVCWLWMWVPLELVPVHCKFSPAWVSPELSGNILRAPHADMVATGAHPLGLLSRGEEQGPAQWDGLTQLQSLSCLLVALSPPAWT